VKKKKLIIKCIPTSLQIKLEAEKGDLHLIDTVLDKIDIVFDGADQIDKGKNLIKGGGGALLRENILINAAKKVVIMADDSKFVTNFNMSVPVEVHPLARSIVIKTISKIGGKPKIRTLERGYPFITENGNIILDCNFGVIKKPKLLQEKIKKISGVLEVGIFTRKPDIIYKARSTGKFDVIK
jgi:ribose 5-phosphate isomerase A